MSQEQFSAVIAAHFAAIIRPKMLLPAGTPLDTKLPCFFGILPCEATDISSGMNVASPSQPKPPAAERPLPQTPWGYLPPRMRVLYISGASRTGSWLAEAFAADSACEVVLEEAVGVAAGLARLRDEVFEAVLIGHDSAQCDAFALLDAIQAGYDEQPLIVLGHQSEQEMAALCYESGADAYICVHATTTRTLIWQIARAMERRQLIAENRRLQQAQQHRLQMEHEEAARLLQQQRQILQTLEHIRGDQPAVAQSPAPTPPAELPPTLVRHYSELLRAYVIMGSGNLTDEMQRLANLLATAGVSAFQAMLLHLHVLEEMVRSLGSRSARHVMNRADLLILEILLNLAESYRERLWNQLHPPRQLYLPGFEPSGLIAPTAG